MDRLIAQILRRFLRQAVDRGVKTGIDHWAGKGRPRAEQSPEERARARQMQDAIKRSRKMIRLLRRIGR
ncbi:hypothetical protein FGG78_26550 [Thioclava sp. BHET1]|nr:hypothetical protein FGG78_26550 [Thioclava sp. BHET1]